MGFVCDWLVVLQVGLVSIELQMKQKDVVMVWCGIAGGKIAALYKTGSCFRQ